LHPRGIARTAENFVICTVVPGKHNLYAFPDGPLRGQQAAGKVRVTAQGFGCKGSIMARVPFGWIDPKYLIDCDTSHLPMTPYCE